MTRRVEKVEKTIVTCDVCHNERTLPNAQVRHYTIDGFEVDLCDDCSDDPFWKVMNALQELIGYNRIQTTDPLDEPNWKEP